MFKKATKTKAKLRLALIGPAGSGKTYTALKLAKEFGEKIAVIDTERGSASKYSHIFSFDVCELPSFHPIKYMEAVNNAVSSGYEVLIIDSLTHAWAGTDGALELVSKVAKRNYGGNTFTAWTDITPLQNELINTILEAKCHVIVTLRAKTTHVVEQDEKGRTRIQKLGLAPIQRDGVEFEFDATCNMTMSHELIVDKTRIETIDGLVINKPGKEFAEKLKAWLEKGAEPEIISPRAVPSQPVEQSSWEQDLLPPEEVWPFTGKMLNKPISQIPVSYLEWFIATKEKGELKVKGLTEEKFEWVKNIYAQRKEQEGFLEGVEA